MDKDADLTRLFDLPASEIVVKSFPCGLKGGITAHGTLYLSQSYLCFQATMFGRKVKEVVPYQRIVRVEERKGNMEVEYKEREGAKVLIFKELDPDPLGEVLNLLASLVDSKRQTPAPAHTQSSAATPPRLGSGQRSVSMRSVTDIDVAASMVPSDDDWTAVLEGTRSEKYTKDTALIRQGQLRQQRIFQIAKGTCRIEKELDNGSTIVLGTITPDDPIFGEISFLDGTGGRATASVIANEDTTVHILEGQFLEILFAYSPGLSGRFFAYLAQILANRLRLRREANETDSRMEDGEEEESESESLSSSTSVPPSSKNAYEILSQSLRGKTKSRTLKVDKVDKDESSKEDKKRKEEKRKHHH